MRHSLPRKLIILQLILPLLKHQTPSRRKHPFISLPEADTAVALVDEGDLGEGDGVFHGAAVAVAMVGLELWGWGGGGGVCHVD